MAEKDPLPRIAIVDDNEANRDLLARRLTKKGYDTICFADGPSVLSWLEDERPELVILDIMMPDMDGFEVLERIREAHDSTALPVVMATALDSSEDIVRALKLGANDYVTKPFDLPVVLARVHTQVSLSQSAARLQAASERMSRDLAAAARVQQALLPDPSVQWEGFRHAWRYLPCDELGGDALQIRELSDGTILLYLLDACGHGVPASLLAVSVSHTLMAGEGQGSIVLHATPESPDGIAESPKRVISRLNTMYPMEQNQGLYFTIAYLLYDASTRLLRLATCGHPPVMLAKADGVVTGIGEPSTPVGLIEPGIFKEVEVSLEPGDRVLVYSDGLVEAENAEGEMYGDSRLPIDWGGARPLEIGDALDTVIASAREWQGAENFEDDLSLLALEVL
jgi:sigma-B regulation protein RsbU (phosphoserine phosphatase)